MSITDDRNPFLPPLDDRNILFEADMLRALIAVILQDNGLRVRGDGIDAGIAAATQRLRELEHYEKLYKNR